jgi:WD40 repeat protein
MDGSLRLWDLDSGAWIGDDWRDKGNQSPITTMALSPSGKTLAGESDDKKVGLWDVETGKVFAKWERHTFILCKVNVLEFEW